MVLVNWIDLVDELNDGARSDLVLRAEHRPDHEVLDVLAPALVVNFVLELCLFLRIFRPIDLLVLENVAADARIRWKFSELR